ncbi:MAG: hypothetical protein HFE27_06255 [Clostridia bacterium]|nr:hypothetical protein [Clostridia bacterium]
MISGASSMATPVSARGDALPTETLPTGDPSLPVFSAVLSPHLPTSVGLCFNQGK